MNFLAGYEDLSEASEEQVDVEQLVDKLLVQLQEGIQPWIACKDPVSGNAASTAHELRCSV